MRDFPVVPMTNDEALMLRDLHRFQVELSARTPEMYQPTEGVDPVNEWYAAMLTYARFGTVLPPDHWLRARQEAEIETFNKVCWTCFDSVSPGFYCTACGLTGSDVEE